MDARYRTVKSEGTLEKLGLVGAATLAYGAAAWAAMDPAKQVAYGKHLSQECSSCHRIDGVDNGIPSIVGWDAQTFRTTLQFYKEGLRTNPAMTSVAQSLDPEQVEALAAYYATVPKPVRKR